MICRCLSSCISLFALCGAVTWELGIQAVHVLVVYLILEHKYLVIFITGLTWLTPLLEVDNLSQRLITVNTGLFALYNLMSTR